MKKLIMILALVSSFAFANDDLSAFAYRQVSGLNISNAEKSVVYNDLTALYKDLCVVKAVCTVEELIEEIKFDKKTSRSVIKIMGSKEVAKASIISAGGLFPDEGDFGDTWL